jgi:hypothetical protein
VQFIDLRPAVPIQGAKVTFSIDPQEEILEASEANNTVVMDVR